MKCNLSNIVHVGPCSNQSDLQNVVIVIVNWDVSLHSSQVAQLHQTRAYPCFCRMKRLGIFLYPLDGMLVHFRVSSSITFAGTHLYTLLPSGERSARVNSHAQEHKMKTMCPARGPFLERPGNLTGPKSDFDIKVSRKLGRFLTSDEVHFVSLADNFTVKFSNLLKLPFGADNKTA